MLGLVTFTQMTSRGSCARPSVLSHSKAHVRTEEGPWRARGIYSIRNEDQGLLHLLCEICAVASVGFFRTPGIRVHLSCLLFLIFDLAQPPYGEYSQLCKRYIKQVKMHICSVQYELVMTAVCDICCNVSGDERRLLLFIRGLT